MRPILLSTPTGDYINVCTIERITIQSTREGNYGLVILPHDALPITLASFSSLEEARKVRDSLIVRISEVLYL